MEEPGDSSMTPFILAAAVTLNIEALSDANVAGQAVNAVDAGTWQVAAEP